jgi:hypothetical protein
VEIVNQCICGWSFTDSSNGAPILLNVNFAASEVVDGLAYNAFPMGVAQGPLP